METMAQAARDLPEEAAELIEAHPKRTRLAGILLALLGVACVAFPWVSTLATQTLVAAALVVGGCIELYYAFVTRPWGKRMRAASVVSGVLAIAAGAILILFPLSGLLALTAFVIGAFVLSGASRIAVAYSARGQKGRTWLAASGAASLVLAVVIFLELPVSAFWLLGTLLGVDLLFHGAALVALTAAVKEEAEHRREDALVDQAAKASFPASDPPGFY